MLNGQIFRILLAAVPLCANAGDVGDTVLHSRSNSTCPITSPESEEFGDELEQGFRNPPAQARPHAYWLWLNGYVHSDSARAELKAMKEAGFGGVLLFDMGARGDKAVQPPAGPAFLSPAWMAQFREATVEARKLGLQVDFSVISSWDLGGHWIEPRHASMALYSTETTVEGGRAIDVALPFPVASPEAPKGADGRPAFWTDVAVLAARNAERQPGRDFVSKDDPDQEKLRDAETDGRGGVSASAGPPPFTFRSTEDLVDLTSRLDRGDRLRWDAPPGRWTILRYVCMNTGERLKVPSPASDGWATDHLNPEATRAHMNYVVARLKETFGEVGNSGLTNLYLASYEVRGRVWSPGFTQEFRRRRGYDMTRWLPAVFGARIGDDPMTDRFLFDYRKTLGEVLVDAYYGAAREVAHQAGLTIKSEAGGPGPPVHNVPVDALLANSAVDEIQGEFWPFRPDADALWVVKETAAAGHIYGKPLVHMEAFTSFDAWREGPQDLKPSADRVFCEGGNHMVWHTWSHVSPEAGKPGWAYLAGTHINRNVTWLPKVRPFIDYLSRASHLLQRGRFVADVLYYYGDGGYKFVGPRKNDPSPGAGYDYDVTNSDVLLHRLRVQDGRLVLPDGTSYAVLVLPSEEDAHPAVMERIEQLVDAGATIVGPRPERAVGLEGYPESDRRVTAVAARLWADLDGVKKKQRNHGKGRVIDSIALPEVLNGMGVQPDFIGPHSLDFIHRQDGAADIYFLRNVRPENVRATVSLRAGNRVPEFWDPRTGTIAPAGVYRISEGRVEVPLSLPPHGSIFVVFRRAPALPAIVRVSGGAEVVMKDGRAVLEAEKNDRYEVEYADGKRSTVPIDGLPAPVRLDGEWTIEFEPGSGAPERIVMAGLASWTQNADPAVRFFSGTARYRKAFTLPKGWLGKGRRVDLDLGNLWTIGEAWVNGKPLGILWTAPFRVDCTEALRDGANELVVEVTNTWYNRLVGDAALPAEKRVTRTNITTSGGQPWGKLQPVDSGLLGPASLIAVAEERISSIPTIDLAGDQDRQIVVDREAGQYLGHPTTVLLEDGKTILCVYPKGHGRGQIVLKRSTDGGRTWSGRLKVPDNWSTSLETPTIHRVIDSTGKKRLILFSGLYPIRMSVSEDDGETWSPLTRIGDFGGIVAMADVVRLRDGRYMAVFHDDGRFISAKPGPISFKVYKTLSTDGGLTWSAPEVIAEHPAAHLCEPGIIRSPDGRQLAMLMRENSRRFNSFIAFSDDEGATWTIPRELPGALTGDRHVGKYTKDGRLFITFRDTNHESPTRGDWVAWVGRYSDLVEGREGQYRIRLMKNHKNADCAYPGLEALPDGTLVTTTYGHWTPGEPPYIVSVRLRLDGEDGKPK